MCEANYRSGMLSYGQIPGNADRGGRLAFKLSSLAKPCAARRGEQSSATKVKDPARLSKRIVASEPSRRQSRPAANEFYGDVLYMRLTGGVD